MKKLTWWLRIVGALYLFLGVLNVASVFLNPTGNAAYFFPATYSPDAPTVLAVNDAYLPSALVFVALGILLLYFSREPERGRIIVLIVALLELGVWVVTDLVWLAHGFPFAFFLPFFIIHLAIGVTGLWFVWQTRPARVNANEPAATRA